MKTFNVDFPKEEDSFNIFHYIDNQLHKEIGLRRKAYSAADKILSESELNSVQSGPNIQGLEEFVEYLIENDVKIGVVTNNSKSCVLKYFQMNEFWRKVITNKDIPIIGRQKLRPDRMKPNSWPLKTIIDQLNLDSSEVLFIGDGVKDYYCAQRQSVDFIGIVQTEQQSEKFFSIDENITLVKDLSQLRVDISKK